MEQQNKQKALAEQGMNLAATLPDIMPPAVMCEVRG